jgi:hypothetical protein
MHLNAHLILSYSTPRCCQRTKKNISVITFQDRLSNFILFCKGSRPLFWHCSCAAHIKITSTILNCLNGHVIFRSQEMDIPVLRQNVRLSLCKLWRRVAREEVECHSFLSYLFISGERSALRSGRFKLRYLFQMRMDRRCGGVNNLLYWPGIEPRFLRHPARTQVPIPTALHCLLQL